MLHPSSWSIIKTRSCEFKWQNQKWTNPSCRVKTLFGLADFAATSPGSFSFDSKSEPPWPDPAPWTLPLPSPGVLRVGVATGLSWPQPVAVRYFTHWAWNCFRFHTKALLIWYIECFHIYIDNIVHRIQVYIIYVNNIFAYIYIFTYKLYKGIQSIHHM